MGTAPIPATSEELGHRSGGPRFDQGTSDWAATCRRCCASSATMKPPCSASWVARFQSETNPPWSWYSASSWAAV